VKIIQKKRKAIRLGLLSCFAWIISYPATADIIVAESCDQDDVQDAVDLAEDGDTVRVPAGNSIWVTSQEHRPCIRIDNKAITLEGAGIGQTVIICNTGSSWGPEDPIHVTGGTGKSFRITGFTFKGTGIWLADNPIVVENGSYLGFRIDHCEFIDLMHGIRINTYAEGLIDHCVFSCLELKNTGDHVAIDVGADQETAWKRPLGIGTQHAVFVEDCVFDYFGTGNSDRPYVAMSNGARVVFRFNKGNNGCIEVFGACPSPSYAGDQRGSVFFSAYHNIFRGNCYCLISQKGGTGIYFNNNISGEYNGRVFELTNYRSANDYAPYGMCDGTSCLDGNEAIDSGTHTGSDNHSVLKCAGKNWIPNQWVGFAIWNETDHSAGKITANTEDTIMVDYLREGYGIIDSGNHTGEDNSQDKLICSSKNWGWSSYRYLYIFNITDGSYGKISSNTPDTITAVLTGGEENDWDLGDSFQLVRCIPRIGIEKDWDSGDAFKIVNGYPCLDQIGRAIDLAPDAWQPQVIEPIYEWNNILNGSDVNMTVYGSELNPCHIQKNRDYYDDLSRPLTAPYQYPHTLAVSDSDGQSLQLHSTVAQGELILKWNRITDAASYRIVPNWQNSQAVTINNPDQTQWQFPLTPGNIVLMVYAVDTSDQILAAEGTVLENTTIHPPSELRLSK
jgi:hypothetical protein